MPDSAPISGPHQGQPVKTTGRAPEKASAAVILVHGRGGSAEDMLGLSQQFGVPALAYLAPQARGHTWYPQSFLAPIERNEPGLSSGLQAIDDVVNTLGAQGIAPENIVIGGFSQGACLALEYVARHARRYGGAFAFSGGLIGPDGTPATPSAHWTAPPSFSGAAT
ncbi:alpha/beta hydrolase [Deinococcus radiopugnans]|uniref:alpha/beta hydrolase n=1 Tax=Deinococcus radiopugnans TaxID=57497 RepID=UPI00360C9428